MDINRYKGCLVGGAAGDALGYYVEFSSLEGIRKEFGEGGIREYVLCKDRALISDDTQMTLFTANALLCAHAQGAELQEYPQYIWRCYKDWYGTQKPMFFPARPTAWITLVPAIQASRAPGLTCLSSLRREAGGTIEAPINDSKGCGGVMRVAPIGLFFAGSDVPVSESDLLGAKAAALTHGHELGYIPAAALVHIVRMLIEGMELEAAVEDSISAMEHLFPQAEYMEEFTAIMRLAVEFSDSSISDEVAIVELGKGGVGEEALAIAVFCALRYRNDFERALIAAVNHGGDSDSTGAVAGNILGAYLGIEGIPQKFLEKLELKWLAEELAAGLFGERGEDFESKYIRCDYRPAED